MAESFPITFNPQPNAFFDGVLDFAWSKDGQFLAICQGTTGTVSGEPELWIYELNAAKTVLNRVVALSSGTGSTSIRTAISCAWNDDGTLLAVNLSRTTSSQNPARPHLFYQFNKSTKALTQIFPADYGLGTGNNWKAWWKGNTFLAKHGQTPYVSAYDVVNGVVTRYAGTESGMSGWANRVTRGFAMRPQKDFAVLLSDLGEQGRMNISANGLALSFVGLGLPGLTEANSAYRGFAWDPSGTYLAHGGIQSNQVPLIWRYNSTTNTFTRENTNNAPPFTQVGQAFYWDVTEGGFVFYPHAEQAPAPGIPWVAKRQANGTWTFSQVVGFPAATNARAARVSENAGDKYVAVATNLGINMKAFRVPQPKITTNSAQLGLLPRQSAQVELERLVSGAQSGLLPTQAAAGEIGRYGSAALFGYLPGMAANVKVPFAVSGAMGGILPRMFASAIPLDPSDSPPPEKIRISPARVPLWAGDVSMTSSIPGPFTYGDWAGRLPSMTGQFSQEYSAGEMIGLLPVSEIIVNNQHVWADLAGLLPTSDGLAVQQLWTGSFLGLLPTTEGEVYQPFVVLSQQLGLLPASEGLAYPGIGVMEGSIGLLPVQESEFEYGTLPYRGEQYGLLPIGAGLLFQRNYLTSDQLGLLPTFIGYSGDDVSIDEGAMFGFLPTSAVEIQQKFRVSGSLEGRLPSMDFEAYVYTVRASGALEGLLPTVEAYGGPDEAATIEMLGLLPVMDSLVAQDGQSFGLFMGLLPTQEGSFNQPRRIFSDQLGLLPVTDFDVYVYEVEVSGEHYGVLPSFDGLAGPDLAVTSAGLGLLPTGDGEVTVPWGARGDLVGLLPTGDGLFARAFRIDSNQRGLRPRMTGLAGVPVRTNGAMVGLLPSSEGVAKIVLRYNGEQLGLLPVGDGLYKQIIYTTGEATGYLPTTEISAHVRYLVSSDAPGLLPITELDSTLRYLVNGDMVGRLPQFSGGSKYSERAFAVAPALSYGGVLSVGGGTFFSFGSTFKAG